MTKRGTLSLVLTIHAERIMAVPFGPVNSKSITCRRPYLPTLPSAASPAAAASRRASTNRPALSRFRPVSAWNRLRENASQAVFARYLNVTTGLVSQWERGEKRPRGASLKLLTLVAKNGLGAVA